MLKLEPPLASAVTQLAAELKTVSPFIFDELNKVSSSIDCVEQGC